MLRARGSALVPRSHLVDHGMSYWEAIILGIVQGLTEFLPISSSAHLLFVPWLFDWEEPGLAFDAALHLGTLTAVFAYFWRDLLGMILALPRALGHPRRYLRDPEPRPGREARPAGDHQARLALLIAVGTVPGLLAGFFGQAAIEGFFHGDGHKHRAVVVAAVLLIVFALLLWSAERVAAHHRQIEHLTWRDAVMIGLAQAAALLPGVSRSGATLTTGLYQGLHRGDAARFSFLLGTPLVLAASVKAVSDTVQAGMSGTETRIFLTGTLVSATVGFIAIWWLLRLLQRAGTGVFVAYRIVAGLSILGVVIFGVK